MKTRMQTLDELGMGMLKPWLKTFKLVVAASIPLGEGADAADVRAAKIQSALVAKFFSHAGVRTVNAVSNLPGKLLEGNWANLEKGMLSYFVPAGEASTIWTAKLQKRTQGPEESVQAYADDYLNIACMASVDVEGWKGLFTSGFRPEISRILKGHRSYKDDLGWVDIVTLAKIIEEDYGITPSAPPTGTSWTATTTARTAEATVSAISKEGRRSKLKPRIDDDEAACGFCGKRGHQEDVCWKKHRNLAPEWFRRRKPTH